ncbi:hypothetical protein [Hymenobacter daeguensis]
MKTKPLIFALGICLMLLTGCVASVGPGYDYGYGGGYYPPARPYYARPYYYNPRPAVIVPARPYYRGGYGGGYHGDRGYHGGGGYNGGGHSRRR